MSALDHYPDATWRPLHWLADAPHGAKIEVLALDGWITLTAVTHGPERGHGATLTVELPPLAALWRYA